MTEQHDAAAQTAEMLGLFPALIAADREAMLRYARVRIMKTRANSTDNAERLFVAPIATLKVTRNIWF